MEAILALMQVKFYGDDRPVQIVIDGLDPSAVDLGPPQFADFR
jgi:hypothetical protein